MKKPLLILTIMVSTLVGLSVMVCACLPFALYSAITITNNKIAIGIENEIKSIELPDDTEFVDSMWLAGKYFGNGHGMQYFGAILVSSDLEVDELNEYYSERIGRVSVVKQETAAIFDDLFYNKWGLVFENFDSQKNNYMVYRIEANTSDWEENGFIEELLDKDFRRY